MKYFKSFVLALLIASTIWSMEAPDDEANKLYQQAYNNVLDKNWDKAIEQFQILLKKYSDSSWEDDAEFWLCYAQEKNEGNLEDSFECMEDFVEDFEDSKWRDDALQNMGRIANELDQHGKPEYLQRLNTIENNENDELTLAAIRALSSRGDKQSYKSILRIYDSNKNDRIRKKMVYIIGSFESDESAEKLKDIAINDPDEEIRSEAIFWLSDSKPDKETAQFLSDLVYNDKSKQLRKKAIFSLADMDNEFGLPYLYSIAEKHKDEDMRADAIFWIGEISKDSKSIQRLSDYAQFDKSEKVQKKALFALAESNLEEATDELIKLSKELKDPELRANAVFWLSQNDVNNKIVEAIKDAAYNDPDEKVQQKAVFALYELKDNKGLDELINIAKNHKSFSIRKKAIFWLGESGEDKAIEALEEILLNNN